MTLPKNHAVGDLLIVANWSLYGSYVAFWWKTHTNIKRTHVLTLVSIVTASSLNPFYFRLQITKGLGAIRAKIGPTSDVDKIFSKMYSQYVLFRNKYIYLICVSNSSQRIDKFRYWKAMNVIFFIIQNVRIIVL
jgi:hypothetical protein